MRSLGFKLVLAFLVVSLIGTAVTVILATRATTNEFGHFVFRQDRQSFVSQFGDYYAERSSWSGVEHLNPGRGPGSMMGAVPMPGGTDAFMAIADRGGFIVRPGAGYNYGQLVSDTILKAGIPIQVNGQQVGTLIEGRPPFAALPTAGQDFLRQVNLALVIATLSATGLALILGILLSPRAHKAGARADRGHQGGGRRGAGAPG